MRIEKRDWDFIWAVLEEVMCSDILKENYIKRLENIRESQYCPRCGTRMSRLELIYNCPECAEEDKFQSKFTEGEIEYYYRRERKLKNALLEAKKKGVLVLMNVRDSNRIRELFVSKVSFVFKIDELEEALKNSAMNDVIVLDVLW